jgi:DNA-binding XRE family transcriptional regulator
MPRSTPTLLPRLARLMAGLGENIKKARLRRAYSSETLAQRAGITRKTLYRVERGDPAVAFGIYARALQALRLERYACPMVLTRRSLPGDSIALRKTGD